MKQDICAYKYASLGKINKKNNFILLPTVPKLCKVEGSSKLRHNLTDPMLWKFSDTFLNYLTLGLWIYLMLQSQKYFQWN